MQENQSSEQEFYYPDNLSAKTTFIGWDWWAAVIIGFGIVISLIFIRAGLMLPLLFTGVFAAVTFKLSDTCIYKQIIIAINYFVADQMLYFWEQHEGNKVPIFYRMKRKESKRNVTTEK